MHNLAQNQATEIPQSEVGREFELLEIQHKTINEQLDRLEHRLEPILAQRAENSESKPNAPDPVRVPLAQRLHGQVVDTTAMVARLQSIISRIEL